MITEGKFILKFPVYECSYFLVSFSFLVYESEVQDLKDFILFEVHAPLELIIWRDDNFLERAEDECK